MIVAELNTEHYQFMAIGDNEEQAKERVAEVFLRHLTQCGSDDPEVEKEHFMASVGVEEDEQKTWVEVVDDWYCIGIWDFTSTTMLRDHDVVGKE